MILALIGLLALAAWIGLWIIGVAAVILVPVGAAVALAAIVFGMYKGAQQNRAEMMMLGYSRDQYREWAKAGPPGKEPRKPA